LGAIQHTYARTLHATPNGQLGAERAPAAGTGALAWAVDQRWISVGPLVEIRIQPLSEAALQLMVSGETVGLARKCRTTAPAVGTDHMD
jgi:hypothetical protein